MKTVFVLVDALKSDYLTKENMPFLYSLSQESRYIKHVIPSPGFCERSEIFSGLDAYDTGCFSAIAYLPKLSQYRSDKFLLKLASGVETISKKYTRFFANKIRIKLKRKMNVYKIPFMSLKYFALTEDGECKFTQYNDIFDVLRSVGKTYTMDAFTSLSDLCSRYKGCVEDFIKEYISKTIDFIPVYIGLIDSVGHRYGADIDKIRPYLLQVDSQLKRIYALTTSSGYAFAVLGDHGMVPVSKKVNIMSKVQELPIKLGKDYEAFYDSTSVRFWSYNDEAKQMLKNMLINDCSNLGTIIDETNYLSYRIPLDIMSDDKPIYGDILWCANPGVLVSPDFFHSEDEYKNGMHGYVKLVYGEGTGLWVAKGPNTKVSIINEAHSSTICSELCSLLEIATPNTNNWKRIVIYG